jgi:ketosteroid isomerase-like protein
MSQENVEIVKEIYADPRGLIGTASERAAPDVEFDFTDVYPDRPVLKGVAEMRRFRETGPWSGSPIHMEPERFFDVDEERVLAFVRVTATGHESGVGVEIRPAHEFTIRDGLIVRFKAYASREEALESAGLSE